MPGVIIILAREPWGPIRIETAANTAELLARGIRPSYHAEVGERDLGQVLDIVRSRLPPADELGLIATGIDRATQAVAQAFSAVPAVVIPPKVENGAGGVGCEAMVAIEAPATADAEFREFRDALKPGKPTRPRRTVPDVDVREIRAKLKLTQDAFAKAFGFAVSTVKDWEQGRYAPEAAARHLLMVIDHRPNVVKDALGRYGLPVQS